MTLLTIGSGHANFKDFLSPNSRARFAAYGGLFDAYYVVAYTRSGFEAQSIGSNVRVYPTNSSSRYFAPFSAFFISLKILSQTRERDEIIISAQDPFESGIVAWAVARLKGHRLHMQIHTDIFSPYFKTASWENRIRVWFARRLLPRADCIRVVSERIRRSLVEILNISADRITVLPIQNERRAESAVARNPSSEFRILTVARLEPEKGVDISLRAFARYRELGGSGDLDIVGDGSQRRSLQALTQDLGVADSVTFHGWAEDVSKYYASAGCFLMTSWYEGWGVAAYDAAAAGIPVVMTDVGLAGEVIQNGVHGIVVPPADISALANGLIQIERDAPMRERIRNAARPAPLSYDEYLVRYRKAFEACL